MTTATAPAPAKANRKAKATEAANPTEATETFTVGQPPATEAGAPDLQSALATEAPPVPTADDVATAQKACFTRAIGRAQALATAENRTILDMASDLQEAVDAFKAIIPKADWWRQRAATLDDFGRSYRLGMNGRTAEPYKWLNALAVYRLASDEAKAVITDGMGGRPFPMATMDAISAWVIYNKADDSYATKAGYEAHLDAIVSRVADEGLTAAQTTDAMNATEATVRLAQAEATGGAKAKATEAKAQASKAKADRSKAITEAVGKLAKAVASEKIGGASASEILNRLADEGLADVAGLIDPATMNATEALAFANRLCELDRADIIFVILTRLRAYEATALADAQASGAPAPALDDTPRKASA